MVVLSYTKRWSRTTGLRLFQFQRDRLVRAGVEPATHGLFVRCSTRLSYLHAFEMPPSFCTRRAIPLLRLALACRAGFVNLLR